MPPNFVLIDEPDALDALLPQLAAAPMFALDTEFHRERTYYAELALIQIAWEGGLALIDPFAVDVTRLRSILESDSLVVIHAAEQDLEVMQHTIGAIPARLFDTQLAAGFCGFSTPSLSTLMQRLIKITPTKGDRLTDWTRRPLSRDQLAYAASDVEHLLQIHCLLVEQLTERGRFQMALDECEQLRTKPRGMPDPDTVWWKMRDARSLRGKSRGVAQALAAWREQRAAETNQPVRHVLPDLSLAAIAHRPPADLDALLAVRSVERRHIRGGNAAAMMEAINRGLGLQANELRLPPSEEEPDRALRPAVTLVSAYLAQLAADLQVDLTLLATRADINALLRSEPGGRLTEGWRAELVGGTVRQLISGDAALSYDAKAARLLIEPRIR